MPIVKITGQGLFAIACSVALLWVCLLAEQFTVRRAAGEREQILRHLQQIRRDSQPTPVIAPSRPHRPAISLG